MPLVPEITDLFDQRRQFGAGRPSSEAPSKQTRKQEYGSAGMFHSLTRSSRRRLRGTMAPDASDRVAFPLAEKTFKGKVCFAPATTSLISSTVPWTDRTSGGTSFRTRFLRSP